MKAVILALVLLSGCGHTQVNRIVYQDGPCPCLNQQACEYWPWPIDAEMPVLCIRE